MYKSTESQGAKHCYFGKIEDVFGTREKKKGNNQDYPKINL